MNTTASWDGWNYSFWSVSNVVSKGLVASVAEPVAPSRQYMVVRARTRRGSQMIQWLTFLLIWGLALSGLYFAWRNGGFYDWLLVWTGSSASLLASVLLFIFAWRETRLRLQHAAVVAQEASGAVVPLTVRAIRRAVLRGDNTLATPLVSASPAQSRQIHYLPSHSLYCHRNGDFRVMSGSY
jgi:hypothetical protein